MENMMKEIKKYAAISLLLTSCAAIADDTPFEQGKTYYFGEGGAPRVVAQVKSIKGNWILISNEEACKYNWKGKMNVAEQCWINTNIHAKVVEIK